MLRNILSGAVLLFVFSGGCEREETPAVRVTRVAPVAAVPPTTTLARVPGATPASRPAATRVLATASGKAYHREGCISLKRSRTLRELTPAQAQASGLRPCSKCQP